MIKRIFALLLSILFCATALVACGASDEKKPTGNQNTDSSDPAGSVNNTPDREVLDTVVMKVGEIDVTYETYRYYFMSCRSNYESQGIAKTVKELQAEVLDEIIYQCAIHSLADRFGAGLTEQQSGTVDLAYAELYQTYKDYESDLETALSLRYMTPKVYKDLYAFETYMVENVFNYCKDEKNGVLDFSEQAVDAMLSEYERVRMIYIGINDERNEANAKKKADGVLELLASGEDFVKVAGERSDLAETNDADVGFYFQKGELDEKVEQAYFALAEGEYTSQAVKTEDGYYILYRIAKDRDYFAKNLYPSYTFNEYLKAYEKELQINYTEFFNTMFDGKNLIPETIK